MRGLLCCRFVNSHATLLVTVLLGGVAKKGEDSEVKALNTVLVNLAEGRLTLHQLLTSVTSELTQALTEGRVSVPKVLALMHCPQHASAVLKPANPVFSQEEVRVFS